MNTYIFYVKNDKGRTINTYTKTCKRPQSTKLYKDLLSLLDKDNNVHSIGYSISSDFEVEKFVNWEDRSANRGGTIYDY
jgi:hypothetical protein